MVNFHEKKTRVFSNGKVEQFQYSLFEGKDLPFLISKEPPKNKSMEFPKGSLNRWYR